MSTVNEAETVLEALAADRRKKAAVEYSRGCYKAGDTHFAWSLLLQSEARRLRKSRAKEQPQDQTQENREEGP